MLHSTTSPPTLPASITLNLQYLPESMNCLTLYFSLSFTNVIRYWSNQVPARSRASVCGRLLAGIVILNPTGYRHVCLL